MNLTRATWQKSSYSGGNGGECVELASAAGVVAVRDSKDPDGPKLVVGRGEFAALVAVLKR
ncbi:DUF397 domain-containing protein [Actinomadura sp. LD22]|uniref:DUF397 domain-containing protein n=1 Tax=Actinomadura physcomitrii TaxID=2650748 RepID=A0A6I4LZM4_9ACTN|nr:DUF397 domain-containing protein [Actinomadura physcomitrii]MVZ98912.1 DUF397 domain-containing protein [Actinomadura physcomitrii]